MQVQKCGGLRLLLLAVFWICLIPSPSAAQVQIELPKIIVQQIEQSITLIDSARIPLANDSVSVEVNGVPHRVLMRHGEASIPYDFPRSEQLSIGYAGETQTLPVNPIPLWLSILPPLIAILMAFLFKEVYSALFTSVVVGASIIAYHQGASIFLAPFHGILATCDTYIIETMSDVGHAQVVLFLLLIGATIAIISINGGMLDLVKWLSKRAKSSKSGQLLTFLMGMAIFFDGYANTLVVGSTMRPMAKKLRMSKEKLAFIVDSTAAPVCSIALITTWIGAELSYIQSGLDIIGVQASAYSLFIASIPSRFYPILMLLFVLVIAMTGRDFGPMFRAERNEHRGTEVESETATDIDNELASPEGVKARWYNAVIPVGVLIAITCYGIFYTGYNASVWQDSNLSLTQKMMDAVGSSDTYLALLWASISSTLVALLLSISQRILSFRTSMFALIKGFKVMFPPIVVLILAWTLALMTKHMHTASFISRALIEWELSPMLLPSLTFVLGAIISFSTGTSWGTMAILYPLVIPVSWELSRSTGLSHDESMSLLLNVISCVLAGAVVGDHCSPISDTTIMSSTATGCDHLSHVRTQMPYAVTVAAVALLLGTIPSTLGVPNWILLIISSATIFLLVRFWGRRTDDAGARNVREKIPSKSPIEI